MSYTVGDGSVVLALAAGIVGYVYVKHQSRRKRLEMIHQERLVAMEKGIPLPEFPIDPARKPLDPDQNVLPILGTVLFSLSVGTMIVLYLTLGATAAHGFWISPLPFAFLGVGFVGFHLLQAKPGR